MTKARVITLNAETPRGRLVCLRAPLENKDGPMPARIVGLKWGDNDTAQGKIKVGEKTLAASKTWDKSGYSEVAIDFNHNTVPTHPSYKGEPAPIAGMSALSVEPGVGLVFGPIEWNADGIAHRKNYPDFSPAVVLDDEGEVIFCHSAALVRNGAVRDLRVFSAEIPADLLTLMAKPDAKDPAHSLKTHTVHKPGQFMINTDLLKKILKLAPDATDDDCNAALEAFGKAGESQANPENVEGDGSANPNPDKPADVTALNAAIERAVAAAIGKVVAPLKAQVTALNARHEQAARDAIVDEAVRAGKIIPKSWLPDDKGNGGLPIDELRTLSADLPEIVPLSARTPRAISSATDAKGALTADEREVMGRLGVSDEAWKRHNK